MASEVAKPYVHQEFPKMVYDHSNSEPAKLIKKGIHEIHVDAAIAFKVVNDQAELNAALEAGFSLNPPSHKADIESHHVSEGQSEPANAKQKRALFGMKK